MKKIILLFFGCMVSLLLHAQAAYDFMAVNSDGLRMYYKISDPVNHYATLTNGDGGLKNPPQVDPYMAQMQALGIKTIRVPATVENGGVTYQVKAIGYQTFFGNSYATHLVLPEGLETIEKSGLWLIYTLQDVNFPSTLKTIKNYALAGLPTVKVFDLSHTKVTELDNVFGLNFNVEQIIFPETLKTIRGQIGYNSAGNFTSVTIPAAVETMGTFQGDNLNTINMRPATPSGSITTPDQAVVKAFTAGKIIPKQTGFILQGAANSTVVYQANVTGTEENVAGNLLIGTATEQEFNSSGYKYYIFSNNGDEGLGFYKQGTRAGASIKLKPHRAGLRLPEAIAPAKGFTIDFESARKEAETTGIRDVHPTVQSRENVIYDLQGRRVTNPGRGIYIVNGKKVVKW